MGVGFKSSVADDNAERCRLLREVLFSGDERNSVSFSQKSGVAAAARFVRECRRVRCASARAGRGGTTHHRANVQRDREADVESREEYDERTSNDGPKYILCVLHSSCA